MTVTQSNPPLYPNQLLKSALYGGVGGAVSIAFEHPFDTLKTRCQIPPHSSPWTIATKIYTTEGVLGLYAGWMPIGLRGFGKQALRVPIMATLPRYLEGSFPEELWKRHPDLIPGLTALAAATFETLAFCPLEKIKTEMQSRSRGNRSFRVIFKQTDQPLHRFLYRGATALYARQTLSWGSFMIITERAKGWERARTGKEILDPPSLLIAGAISGGLNTALIMPIDGVKTAMQCHQNRSTSGIVATAKKIYGEYGLKGLYAGWQPRMAQFMIHATIITAVLEELKKT